MYSSRDWDDARKQFTCIPSYDANGRNACGSRFPFCRCSPISSEVAALQAALAAEGTARQEAEARASSPGGRHRKVTQKSLQLRPLMPRINNCRSAGLAIYGIVEHSIYGVWNNLIDILVDKLINLGNLGLWHIYDVMAP
jgi:hypothetical protein